MGLTGHPQEPAKALGELAELLSGEFRKIHHDLRCGDSLALTGAMFPLFLLLLLLLTIGSPTSIIRVVRVVIVTSPKAARISELLAGLDQWVRQLTPVSYGSDELLFGWYPNYQRRYGRNADPPPRENPRRSPMKTCMCCCWNWLWRKNQVSTETPIVLAAKAVVRAVGTKDNALDRTGRMPAT